MVFSLVKVAFNNWLCLDGYRHSGQVWTWVLMMDMQQSTQLDLFENPPVTPANLADAPIASRDDILKVNTAILYDGRTKPLEKIRASELICKIQGFLKDNTDNSAAIVIKVEHVHESL